MDNKNTLGRENTLYLMALGAVFILNYFLVVNNVATIIPTVVIPIFLLSVDIKYGSIKTLIAVLVGVIPFFILKSESMIITNYLVYFVNYLGLKYIYGKKFNKWKNLSIISATTIFSTFLGFLYTIISRYSGSFYNYFVELSNNINTMTFMLSQAYSSIPKENLLEMIGNNTPNNLSHSYITILIVSSIFTAYITLRLLHVFLTFDQNRPSVNLMSEVKASPILIMALLLITGIGTVLENKFIFAMYFKQIGFSLLGVLGIVVFSSLLINKLNVISKSRNKLFKLLILIIVDPIIGVDAMILFAILDSVIDFRNLTTYGLKRYYSSKLKKNSEDKNNG